MALAEMADGLNAGAPIAGSGSGRKKSRRSLPTPPTDAPATAKASAAGGNPADGASVVASIPSEGPETPAITTGGWQVVCWCVFCHLSSC